MMQINMARNYSEWIKCPRERTLTAKGAKFMQRIIEIAAENKGIHRMHKDFKPYKEQIRKLVINLFIDKGMTKDQIIGVIKERTVIKGLSND